MNPFVSPSERADHVRALELLTLAGVPFLVGGAYAMFHYTGVVRYTKDLDLFLRREDEARAREVLSAAGWSTHVHEPLWLSKAQHGATQVDLIYSSGNGLAVVDDVWLGRAPQAAVLGVPARLVPPEEMVWSKAFVQERDRWDGADVAHLLRACGPNIDWKRLLAHFGEDHWHVLAAHLVLFAFSFPDDRSAVPGEVWRWLSSRVRELETGASERCESKRCRGTLLSRIQYLPDLELWGYRDARDEVPGYLPPVALRPESFARHATEADVASASEA
jgi:hypothetical protein